MSFLDNFVNAIGNTASAVKDEIQGNKVDARNELNEAGQQMQTAVGGPTTIKAAVKVTKEIGSVALAGVESFNPVTHVKGLVQACKDKNPGAIALHVADVVTMFTPVSSAATMVNCGVRDAEAGIAFKTGHTKTGLTDLAQAGIMGMGIPGAGVPAPIQPKPTTTDVSLEVDPTADLPSSPATAFLKRILRNRQLLTDFVKVVESDLETAHTSAPGVPVGQVTANFLGHYNAGCTVNDLGRAFEKIAGKLATITARFHVTIQPNEPSGTAEAFDLELLDKGVAQIIHKKGNVLCKWGVIGMLISVDPRQHMPKSTSNLPFLPLSEQVESLPGQDAGLNIGNMYAMPCWSNTDNSWYLFGFCPANSQGAGYQLTGVPVAAKISQLDPSFAHAMTVFFSVMKCINYTLLGLQGLDIIANAPNLIAKLAEHIPQLADNISRAMIELNENGELVDSTLRDLDAAGDVTDVATTGENLGEFAEVTTGLAEAGEFAELLSLSDAG